LLFCRLCASAFASPGTAPHGGRTSNCSASLASPLGFSSLYGWLCKNVTATLPGETDAGDRNGRVVYLVREERGLPLLAPLFALKEIGGLFTCLCRASSKSRSVAFSPPPLIAIISCNTTAS